jgi:hypothetical protein
MAAVIAVLKASREHGVECDAGNDAELAGAGNSIGKPPGGDGHAHPALDDHGE